jgi:regulator of RNase E activity RraA
VLFRALAEPREGAILVVEAGDLISGVWGELLSTAAIARGFVGMVTDGLTRDITGITDLRFPVYATGASPLDSAGRQDFVSFGGSVNLGGVTIRPDDWVVADNLGAVVIPAEHLGQVIERGLIKMSGESIVREELAAGEDLGAVFRRHGIL